MVELDYSQSMYENWLIFVKSDIDRHFLYLLPAAYYDT